MKTTMHTNYTKNLHLAILYILCMFSFYLCMMQVQLIHFISAPHHIQTTGYYFSNILEVNVGLKNSTELASVKVTQTTKAPH
jgi:hypothetical protein